MQQYLMKGPAYGMPMHPAHFYGMGPPPNMRMNDGGYGGGRHHGNNNNSRYNGRGEQRNGDRNPEHQPRGRGRSGRKDARNVQDEYQVCGQNKFVVVLSLEVLPWKRYVVLCAVWDDTASWGQSRDALGVTEDGAYTSLIYAIPKGVRHFMLNISTLVVMVIILTSLFYGHSKSLRGCGISSLRTSGSRAAATPRRRAGAMTVAPPTSATLPRRPTRLSRRYGKEYCLSQRWAEVWALLGAWLLELLATNWFVVCL